MTWFGGKELWTVTFFNICDNIRRSKNVDLCRIMSNKVGYCRVMSNIRKMSNNVEYCRILPNNVEKCRGPVWGRGGLYKKPFLILLDWYFKLLGSIYQFREVRMSAKSEFPRLWSSNLGKTFFLILSLLTELYWLTLKVIDPAVPDIIGGHMGGRGYILSVWY